MNLKALLDEVRRNLHAPVPQVRAALIALDRIEAEHCQTAPVEAAPAAEPASEVLADLGQQEDEAVEAKQGGDAAPAKEDKGWRRRR